MATNLASIYPLLRPGLFALPGRYALIKSVIEPIYENRKSSLAVEQSTTMRYLQTAALRVDGGQTKFDNNAGSRFSYQFEHLNIALGYAITRNSIDDNLYKADFNPLNIGLIDSFHNTKENYAMAPFNNSTIYNPLAGGDGQPLLSTQHPIDGGVYANTFDIPVDLSYESYTQAATNIRTKFRDQANKRVMIRAKRLFVPAELEPTALTIHHSKLVPGTSNNNTNVIDLIHGGIKLPPISSEFIVNPRCWFVLTTAPGFQHFVRTPFEVTSDVDFSTDNLLVKGFERYSFGYNDPMCVYGSFPI